jgi:hypothetical protein
MAAPGRLFFYLRGVPPRPIAKRWLPFMTRLTYILALGLIGLGLVSSTIEKRKFKGDLYFKLISIGSFYQADSLKVKKFERTLDSLMRLDKGKLSKDDIELVTIYGGLKKHGLIDKPVFDLRIDSTTTYIVYTSSTEFNKIKDFKRADLINENKKVKIELTGEIINLGTLNVLSCSTIDKVEKVDGKTYWRK